MGTPLRVPACSSSFCIGNSRTDRWACHKSLSVGILRVVPRIRCCYGTSALQHPHVNDIEASLLPASPSLPCKPLSSVQSLLFRAIPSLPCNPLSSVQSLLFRITLVDTSVQGGYVHYRECSTSGRNIYPGPVQKGRMRVCGL